VFGGAEVGGLWGAVEFTLRMGADDPAAAWQERMDQLEGRAAGLNERRFDAVRFTGPGTDLTVGLLPEARFAAKAGPSGGGLFAGGAPRNLVRDGHRHLLRRPAALGVLLAAADVSVDAVDALDDHAAFVVCQGRGGRDSLRRPGAEAEYPICLLRDSAYRLD